MRIKNNLNFTRILILVALLFTTISVFWATSEKKGENQKLAEAIKIIHKKSDFEKAVELLQDSRSNPILKDWSNLYLAKVYIKKEEIEKAKTELRKIKNDGLEKYLAQLELLKLGDRTITGSEISRLETVFKKLDSRNLLPELLIAKADIAKEKGELRQAKSLLNKARIKATSREIKSNARNKLYKIVEANPETMGFDTISTNFEEAKLLLNNKEPELALEFVRKAGKLAKKKSTAYFEAKNLEFKTLKSLSRNDEADHLLSIISADGPKSLADRAMLEMAKRSWNNNENDKALKLLKNLETEHRRGSMKAERKYIKARILSEAKRWDEAKKTYANLIKYHSSTHGVIANKKKAWIHLVNEEFDEAAKHLLELRKETDLKALTIKDNKALRSDQLHARYWLYRTIDKLSEVELKKLKISSEFKEQLKNEIQKIDRYNYYSYLIGNEVDLSPVEDQSLCRATTDPKLEQVLEFLSSAKLYEIAKLEVDYHYLDTNWLSDIKTVLARAHLKSKYSIAQYALQDIHKYRIKVLNEGIILGDCEKELMRAGLPTPYLNSYKLAADKYKMELPLLYAISRTESWFNPDAKSVKGAIGLMQLMPETAKKEGLKEGEELNDPAVNITLGSKHILGLFKKYQGVKPYAVAAYNAGSFSVERWRQRYPNLKPNAWAELISYPETNKYVKEVSRMQWLYQNLLEVKKIND